MIDRIIHYLSGNPPPTNKTTPGEVPASVDCFECRMVGGTGLTALGGYIMYYAYQKQKAKSTSTKLPFSMSAKLPFVTSAALGSIIMSLGVCRLIGIHELNQPNHKHKHLKKDQQKEEEAKKTKA